MQQHRYSDWLNRRLAYLAIVVGVATAITPADARPRTGDLRRTGIAKGQIVHMRSPVHRAGNYKLQIPIEGELRTITLSPVSLQSTNRNTSQKTNAHPGESTSAPVPTTFRGSVVELPGSRVAASKTKGGWRFRILLADGESYWVEPTHAAPQRESDPDEFMIYRESDLPSSESRCSVMQEAPVGLHSGTVADATTSPGMFIADLVIDTDVEFYQQFGNAQDVRDYIESVINAVNIQYERDAGITHRISSFVIRSSDTGVYTGTDAATLLGEVKAQWEDDPLNRDALILFTGKELEDSTVGMAWIGSICSPGYGYSLVQTGFSANWASQTDLVAHELGHNWGAHHCGYDGPGDPDDCEPSCLDSTMNCFITGSNAFHETRTIPDILAYRDGAYCLSKDTVRRLTVRSDSNQIDEDSVLPLSVEATFALSGIIDVTDDAWWTVDPSSAGVIDDAGVFHPSAVDRDTCVTVTATYSLDGQDFIDEKNLVLNDIDTTRTVLDSVPPIAAIDARQPHSPHRTMAQGWQSIDLTFNGENCLVTPAGIVINELGGTAPIPSIEDIESVDALTLRLHLDASLEPGTVTTVNETGANSSFWVGFLPGDVNANGVTNSDDVDWLIDSIQGNQPALPGWSTDIDRSGESTPADLLRLIDILQGGGLLEVWDGQTLPPN